MTATMLRGRLPELWAGVECTVNRVGDSYSDQLERSGHALRINDLERLAELGVRRLRYPILWERTAPRDLSDIDWSWSDERMKYLQRLDLQPIAGLVHHGSDPRYTSLLDPQFPEKLAEYAAAVAQRYPWVTEYTPVNEPLRTARFSCLYGHWYPHKRESLAFAKAFLAQCRGIVLAMRSIRAVNSEAKLITTEDLGKTFSTPTLAYQAQFENELAAISLIDYLNIPSGTRASRIGLLHGLTNVAVVILFVVSWLLRRGSPETPSLVAFAFSFIGVAAALLGGWLGGELVERLGVGVTPGANLNAPNSLTHGARETMRSYDDRASTAAD